MMKFLKNYENLLNKYKKYHAQKGLKFASVVELAKLKFTYITVLK